MGKFNLVKYLKNNGYNEEIIRREDKSIFCRNYQKEINPDEWNAITIFNSKLMSAASTTKLEFKNIPIPKNLSSAKNILKVIENGTKQPTEKDQKIDTGKDRSPRPEE